MEATISQPVIKSYIDKQVNRQITNKILSVCDSQDMLRHADWFILLSIVLILLSLSFIYYIWKNENPTIRFWLNIIITLVVFMLAYFLISKFLLKK